jgi:hypothetical protein
MMSWVWGVGQLMDLQHTSQKTESHPQKPLFQNAASFIVQEVSIVDDAAALFFGCDRNNNLRSRNEALSKGSFVNALVQFEPAKRQAVPGVFLKHTIYLHQLLDFPTPLFDL